MIASQLAATLCEWNTPTPVVWQEHIYNSSTGIVDSVHGDTWYLINYSNLKHSDGDFAVSGIYQSASRSTIHVQVGGI